VSRSAAAEAGARLRVLAAAALFSTGGAAIKASSLSGFQVASFRSAVAALVVLAILPRSRSRWTTRTWVVGAAYAMTMALFVVANKLTTAANSIFLQYTSPVYVMVAGPWFLHEPVRRRDVAFFLVVLGALALFFVDASAATATAPRPMLGNSLALLSGVAWAATAIGLRWMARPDADGAPVETAVACGNLVAFAACLPFALPVSGARVADGAIIAYLGVFQIAGAYYFLSGGLRLLSALDATLLLMLEPVLNPVWAWLFHGERPGAWSLVGGAVILAVSTLRAWYDSRRPARPLARAGMSLA
jgi:DME family drug/metabolite transporter